MVAKKKMAVRTEEKLGRDVFRSSPNKYLQDRASAESKARKSGEGVSRSKNKKANSKLHSKRGRVYAHSTKNKSPSVREAATRKRDRITDKRIKLQDERDLRKRKLPKRESVSSERLSSKAQSKDVKKTTKAVRPKKPQAKRVVKKVAKKLLKGVAKRAGAIGAAYTAKELIEAAAKRKAKKISSKGVGGAKNRANINKFRAKTPSRAHTAAKKKLSRRRK